MYSKPFDVKSAVAKIFGEPTPAPSVSAAAARLFAVREQQTGRTAARPMSEAEAKRLAERLFR